MRWLLQGFIAGSVLMLVALSLPSPIAHAARVHQVAIIDQADSPLKILEASSRYEDTSVTPNFYWRMGAKVRNTSQKRIVAYELRWILFDSFDGQRDTVIGVSDTPLAAGAEANPAWQKVAIGGAIGVKAAVSILRIRFEDGVIWNAAAPAQSAQACDDALKAERQRLLQIYQSQGVDALLTELRK